MNRMIILIFSIISFNHDTAIAQNLTQQPWTFLEKNRYNEVWVNIKSIQRSGNLAKMWHALNNFKRTDIFSAADMPGQQIKYYLSANLQVEYDCYNQTMRPIETVYFSEKNLNGNIVKQKKNNYSVGLMNQIFGKLSWNEIAKLKDASNPALWNSNQALWNFVCNKGG